MATNVLVSLADKNYVDPVKQLFSSVYHSAGWQGDYLLLCHELEDRDIQWFDDKGIITKVVEPVYDKDLEHFPSTILSKLYLFGTDFKRWERVTFLDGDITVKACIDRLMEPRGFCAVEDVHAIPLRKQFHRPGHFSDRDPREKLDGLKKKYDMERIAFNVGVFSFDTDIIGTGTFRKLLDLFEGYGLLSPYNEQAVMNLFFYDRWTPMPLVYNNYYLHVRPYWKLKPKTVEGICNHFIFQKPWKVKQGRYYTDWLEYLRMAEAIDLDERPPPVKIWTEKEITEWTDHMRRMMVHQRRSLLLNNRVMELMEKGIGMGGKMLRSISPSLYRRVRGGR